MSSMSSATCFSVSSNAEQEGSGARAVSRNFRCLHPRAIGIGVEIVAGVYGLDPWPTTFIPIEVGGLRCRAAISGFEVEQATAPVSATAPSKTAEYRCLDMGEILFNSKNRYHN